jgi:hypothetical protein
MSTITCFDLWMSKGAYDIFALAINFLDENWQPKKVTFILFEAKKTIVQAFVRNLRELLDSYRLSNKIIAYVKDEGVDLNSMTATLKLIINHVLVMHFPKPITMLFLKRGYAKILSMS